jgi:hypothetical protein
VVDLPGPETAVLAVKCPARPYKTLHKLALLRETLRALNHPGRDRTVA